MRSRSSWSSDMGGASHGRPAAHRASAWLVTANQDLQGSVIHRQVAVFTDGIRRCAGRSARECTGTAAKIGPCPQILMAFAQHAPQATCANVLALTEANDGAVARHRMHSRKQKC